MRLALIKSKHSTYLKICSIEIVDVSWVPKYSTEMCESFKLVTNAGHSQNPRILHKTTSPNSTLTAGFGFLIDFTSALALEFFLPERSARIFSVQSASKEI